ncbi:MAG: SDR family NAD(P)-dependent oxidoreductase [Bdellovibrionales bacterium]
MARWALVTGAGKRIGRAIALDLASHGWDIVVHYHHSGKEAQQLAEEIQEMGQSACLAEIDLADAKSTEQLIPSLTKELGAINALINNASMFEPDETDPDGKRHFAVNAEAPRILGKSFRDSLPKGDRGVIINMLDATLPSDSTVIPAKAGIPFPYSSYARSKKFLSGMTLNMAKSFAPKIRVNGVAPLYVLPSPRQTKAAFLKMAGNKITPPEKVAEAVRQLIETPSATGEIVTLSPTIQ